jgi:hypothetical protein
MMIAAGEEKGLDRQAWLLFALFVILSSLPVLRFKNTCKLYVSEPLEWVPTKSSAIWKRGKLGVWWAWKPLTHYKNIVTEPNLLRP